MSCRVLLVEACPMVIDGLDSIFRSTEFTVAHSTDSFNEAIEWLSGDTCNLVMTEFQFSDGTSHALQKAANRYELPLVLFSEWQNPVFVARMVSEGAHGLIPKTASGEEVLSGLRRVMNGKKIWHRKDVRKVTGAMATPRLEGHIDFPLTRRESEVLREMARGNTNKQIAESLGISFETVKEHVQHILDKLWVADRTQAATRAVRRGVL